MSQISIIAGSSHPRLAERIARNLGLGLTDVSCIKFKNDNSFVRIKECIRNHDVYIVQTSAVPVNDNLVELLLLIDAAKYASAKRITAVVPYYPYVRSDKKDQPRVPVTARLVADLLVTAGVDRVLTMDLHADQITGFFRCRYDQFYASSVLLPHLRSKDLTDCCILSPDVGGMKRARFFAQELNLPLAIFNKQRLDNNDHAEVAEVIGTVDGLHCILIDDEVSTGGSVLSVAKNIKEMGAKSLTVVCIHGVFVQNALERLQQADIKEVVCTDTLPVGHLAEKYPCLTVLEIADILAEGIRRTHEGESIGAMFGHN
jgi:ribose-phosphate pyrophosphokinase